MMDKIDFKYSDFLPGVTDVLSGLKAVDIVTQVKVDKYTDLFIDKNGTAVLIDLNGGNAHIKSNKQYKITRVSDDKVELDFN